jgi:hypothetical protein
MHPYLTRLGIGPGVQQYFGPFYESDEEGNLCFPYGGTMEHFGFGFHYIPVSDHFWMAGNLNFSQVRQVIISGSALDGVSWLKKKAALLYQTENLLFLSTGTAVQTEHIRWLLAHLPNKEYCLIYGNDLLDRIAAMKIAAGIRGVAVEIYAAAGEQIAVCFRSRVFYFSQENFTLNAFEKAAKFRFGIRCDRPKNHLTFFDELKAEALFTL